MYFGHISSLLYKYRNAEVIFTRCFPDENSVDPVDLMPHLGLHLDLH